MRRARRWTRPVASVIAWVMGMTQAVPVGLAADALRPNPTRTSSAAQDISLDPAWIAGAEGQAWLAQRIADVRAKTEQLAVALQEKTYHFKLGPLFDGGRIPDTFLQALSFTLASDQLTGFRGAFEENQSALAVTVNYHGVRDNPLLDRLVVDAVHSTMLRTASRVTSRDAVTRAVSALQSSHEQLQASEPAPLSEAERRLVGVHVTELLLTHLELSPRTVEVQAIFEDLYRGVRLEREVGRQKTRVGFLQREEVLVDDWLLTIQFVGDLGRLVRGDAPDLRGPAGQLLRPLVDEIVARLGNFPRDLVTRLLDATYRDMIAPSVCETYFRVLGETDPERIHAWMGWIVRHKAMLWRFEVERPETMPAMIEVVRQELWSETMGYPTPDALAETLGTLTNVLAPPPGGTVGFEAIEDAIANSGRSAVEQAFLRLAFLGPGQGGPAQPAPLSPLAQDILKVVREWPTRYGSMAFRDLQGQRQSDAELIQAVNELIDNGLVWEPRFGNVAAPARIIALKPQGMTQPPLQTALGALANRATPARPPAPPPPARPVQPMARPVSPKAMEVDSTAYESLSGFERADIDYIAEIALLEANLGGLQGEPLAKKRAQLRALLARYREVSNQADAYSHTLLKLEALVTRLGAVLESRLDSDRVAGLAGDATNEPSYPRYRDAARRSQVDTLADQALRNLSAVERIRPQLRSYLKELFLTVAFLDQSRAAIPTTIRLLTALGLDVGLANAYVRQATEPLAMDTGGAAQAGGETPRLTVPVLIGLVTKAREGDADALAKLRRHYTEDPEQFVRIARMAQYRDAAYTPEFIQHTLLPLAKGEVVPSAVPPPSAAPIRIRVSTPESVWLQLAERLKAEGVTLSLMDSTDRSIDVEDTGPTLTLTVPKGMSPQAFAKEFSQRAPPEFFAKLHPTFQEWITEQAAPPKPLVGSTAGHLHGAILQAVDALRAADEAMREGEGSSWTAQQAAVHIATALRTLPPWEDNAEDSLVNLPLALAILNQANATSWPATELPLPTLRSLVASYATSHDYDGLRADLQRALRLRAADTSSSGRATKPEAQEAHLSWLPLEESKPFSWRARTDESYADPLAIRRLAIHGVTEAEAPYLKGGAIPTGYMSREILGIAEHGIQLPNGESVTLHVTSSVHWPVGWQADAARWRSLLERALAREGRTLDSLADLPDKVLTIILADEYEAYAGDHVGNGIVILHRKLFDDPSRGFPTHTYPGVAAAVSEAMVLTALAHELGAHELPKAGREADTPERQAKDLINLRHFAESLHVSPQQLAAAFPTLPSMEQRTSHMEHADFTRQARAALSGALKTDPMWVAQLLAASLGKPLNQTNALNVPTTASSGKPIGIMVFFADGTSAAAWWSLEGHETVVNVMGEETSSDRLSRQEEVVMDTLRHVLRAEAAAPAAAVVAEVRAHYKTEFTIGIRGGGSNEAVGFADRAWKEETRTAPPELNWRKHFLGDTPDLEDRVKALIEQEGPEALRLGERVVEEAIRSVLTMVVRTGLSMDHCHGILVSFPGPVDDVAGTVATTFKAANIPGLRNFPMRERIQRALKAALGVSVPVRLKNDTGASLEAETGPYGTAPGVRNAVYGIRGTGINDAALKDGQLFTAPADDGLPTWAETGHAVIGKVVEGRIVWEFRGDTLKGQRPVLGPDEFEVEQRLGGPALLEFMLRPAGFASWTAFQEAHAADHPRHAEAVALNLRMGREMGRALAPLIAHYFKAPYHFEPEAIIPGSGVVEHRLEVFITAFQQGFAESLVQDFGLDAADAQRLASRVVRTKLTGDREIAAAAQLFDSTALEVSAKANVRVDWGGLPTKLRNEVSLVISDMNPPKMVRELHEALATSEAGQWNPTLNRMSRTLTEMNPADYHAGKTLDDPATRSADRSGWVTMPDRILAEAQRTVEGNVAQMEAALQQAHSGREGGSIRYVIIPAMGGSKEIGSGINEFVKAQGLATNNRTLFFLDTSGKEGLAGILRQIIAMEQERRRDDPRLAGLSGKALYDTLLQDAGIIVFGISMGLTSEEPVINMTAAAELVFREAFKGLVPQRDGQPDEHALEALIGAHFWSMTLDGSTLHEFLKVRGWGDHRLPIQLDGNSTLSGRNSYVSRVALLPLAFLGLSVTDYLAAQAAPNFTDADREEAFRLSAVLSAAEAAGYSQPTFLLPDAYQPFGFWLGQGEEESVGKHHDHLQKVHVPHRVPWDLLNLIGPKKPRQHFVHVKAEGLDDPHAADIPALQLLGYPVVTVTLRKVPGPLGALPTFLHFWVHAVLGLGRDWGNDTVGQYFVELYKKYVQLFILEAMKRGGFGDYTFDQVNTKAVTEQKQAWLKRDNPEQGSFKQTEPWQRLQASPHQATFNGVTLYFDGMIKEAGAEGPRYTEDQLEAALRDLGVTTGVRGANAAQLYTAWMALAGADSNITFGGITIFGDTAHTEQGRAAKAGWEIFAHDVHGRSAGLMTSVVEGPRENHSLLEMNTAGRNEGVLTLVTSSFEPLLNGYPAPTSDVNTVDGYVDHLLARFPADYLPKQTVATYQSYRDHNRRVVLLAGDVTPEWIAQFHDEVRRLLSPADDQAPEASSGVPQSLNEVSYLQRLEMLGVTTQQPEDAGSLRQAFWAPAFPEAVSGTISPDLGAAAADVSKPQRIVIHSSALDAPDAAVAYQRIRDQLQDVLREGPWAIDFVTVPAGLSAEEQRALVTKPRGVVTPDVAAIIGPKDWAVALREAAAPKAVIVSASEEPGTVPHWGNAVIAGVEAAAAGGRLPETLIGRLKVTVEETQGLFTVTDTLKMEAAEPPVREAILRYQELVGSK